MGQQDKNNVKDKRSTGKLRIVFSSMMLFILLIAEIYMMIHSSDYIVGLITITVLLVAVMYILVASLFQVNYEKEKEQYELFEEIFKSEKASYLLMRKNFEELTERLEFIVDNMKVPTEEIIEAQKAIAKVSISRNKENTDALMNSNDKLLEKFLNFEQILFSNNEKIFEQQKLITEQENKEILLRHQEELSKIKEAELSIKNEILQSVNKISSIQLQSVISAPKMSQQAIQSVTPEPIQQSEPYTEQNTAQLDDEISSFDDFHFDDEPEVNMESEEEPVMEESIVEEPVVEEPVVEEPMVEEPAVEEPAVQETFMEQPIIEEPQIVKDVEEKPEEEEKPPMPDLSDPNRIMTPEEIAALLANM